MGFVVSGDKSVLVGRVAELEELSARVGAARNRVGQALRLVGEPGIGKTALVEAAIERANGFRVLRADGFEVEQALPYAGVQRLLARADAPLTELPAHHREALLVAIGHRGGPVPNRFLVGQALLGLFALAARGQPVLCAIDDAQWVDRESLDALGFAARRLHADAVLVLFASRPDTELDMHLGGIAVHPVAELERATAIELLTARLGVRFDPLIAADIVAEVGGNPLALTDLAHDFDARQLADSSFAPHPRGAGHRLEQLYRRQVRDLPPTTQDWLLIAAAEATGDLRLVDAAAGALGVPESAGEAADSAGLVIVDGAARFRHPLIRAAVYGAAPAADRRRVHAALAAAAARRGLDDVHAWHAAEAAPRQDDAVAALLVAAAERAAQRGGLISRTSLLGKAAELTTDPVVRHEHLLGAAEAAAEAGAGYLALDLLERIDDSACAAPSSGSHHIGESTASAAANGGDSNIRAGAAAPGEDPVMAGRRLMVRASLAIFLIDEQQMPLAPYHLKQAAELFHGHDPHREQLALLRAFDALLPVERLVRGTTATELGRLLRAAATTGAGVVPTVLNGLAALILDPFPEAVAPMRAAVAAIADLDDARILLFGTAGVALTTALWDERARDRHLAQGERVAVARGALKSLDTYLWTHSMTDVDRGDLPAAERTIERLRETRRAMGYPAEHVINGGYLAWTGARYEDVEQLAAAMLSVGLAGVHSGTTHGLAVRDLADGRYDSAYQRLKSLRENAFLQTGPRFLPEHVEAAVRSGHLAEAAAVTAELTAIAEATGSAWAAGISSRCRALIDETPAAEAHFHSALAALATTDTPGDLYRTHLLYGEWLRRKRRRKDAGSQLRRARDGFTATGVTMFADRAQRELAALGEQLATPGQLIPRIHLTVQESQVTTLAAAGATNAEIAATLFISPNTVDYHLRKIFRKLGISSRRQLREHLAATEPSREA
ncbi:AAA family ATPase [Nocardia sp. NPDC057668]|uniref:helix-turn-helix transcriptional regulator n=1 Tax=Nocardia sp. NPDC057668 TaxID=3346202 RepID=UPI0036716469